MKVLLALSLLFIVGCERYALRTDALVQCAQHCYEAGKGKAICTGLRWNPELQNIKAVCEKDEEL